MFYNSIHELEQVLLNISLYFYPPQITPVKMIKLDTSSETNQWMNFMNLDDNLVSCKCMVMSRVAVSSTEDFIKGIVPSLLRSK